LARDAPDRFAAWAAEAVGALGPVCHRWITINEPNVLAVQSWYFGVFPPGRLLDHDGLTRALDHLVAAHVLAYDAIKAVQPHAVVTTNPYPFSAYHSERALTDVLSARRHGIARLDVPGWLADRAEAFHRDLPSHGPREALARRWAAAAVPTAGTFDRALDAVYASPHELTLDEVHLDWYDPRTDHKFRLPGHRTAGGRSWWPGRMLWDDPVDPAGMVRYLELYQEPDRPLVIAENGLCNRVRRGVSHPRADGWDRVRYLRANLGGVATAILGGVPVNGYFHWCLADNYEWGSYEPRFGLYGIDRDRGVRWSDHDSMGGPAARTYREIIEGLRGGDLGVVALPPTG